jgi:hypothetical protein
MCLLILSSQHPSLPVGNQGIFLHLGRVFVEVLAVDILPKELNMRISGMLKKMLDDSTGEFGRKLQSMISVEKRETLTRLGYL